MPQNPIIDPQDMLRRVGVDSPTATQVEAMTDTILDCQADVEGYLKRPLVPYQAVLARITPAPGFPLDSWRAWPDARQYDDTVAVTSTVDNLDGTYDVTFAVGLDAAAEAPIVRYIRAHVKETLRNDAASGLVGRVVTSVSADGQSVSYAAGSTTAGAAGAPPSLESLRGYRRLVVYTRPAHRVPLWPNG